MKSTSIHLLVTFDQNYIAPFETMLTSILLNNPGEQFHVWLLHSAIPQTALDALEHDCRAHGVPLTPIAVERQLFQGAPITKQYPQEMYYRLLASHILPASLKRVLYLDPDILVINPLRPLWDLDLQGNVFAAASHIGVVDVMNGINRIRLKTEQDYYNSGVMLMDLEAARVLVQPEAIFQYVRDHENELLLPDQDVFNSLYGAQTLQIDDALWNYDARYYSGYLLRSGGAYHMDWVMQHTAILHFWRQAKALETFLCHALCPFVQTLSAVGGSFRRQLCLPLCAAFSRLIPGYNNPKSPFPQWNPLGERAFIKTGRKYQ